MELLNHIKLEECLSIDFIDELTMIVTDNYEGVYKYTRVNEESLDWTEDNEIEDINDPKIVRCIDSNLYVISDNKELYWLDKDLKNK